jgi:hypothetical protein
MTREDAPHRLFVWNSFLQNGAKTVIVMPSPHGEYKSGISYNDSIAVGEIYANFPKRGHFDIRTPEFLGGDTSENLILVGGKKANPVTKTFQTLTNTSSVFDLDDGVIYDKEKHVVVTPEYASGQRRTIGNLLADYGLVFCSNNPFGKSTKVLQLAGIKGFGTLAAAIAFGDSSIAQTVETLLRQLLTKTDVLDLKNQTLEMLLRVSVLNGRADRGSIQIHKIRFGNERKSRTWESETYSQLKAENPHRLYVDVIRRPSATPMVRTKINNQEVRFPKSVDRQNVIYCLAKQAKEDYLNQSENEGWVTAILLAERLWQVKHEDGNVEIPDEIKRQITQNIKRWAAYLQRRGELTLAESITLDSEYINSEILVFDSDIKKRIVDLIHIVNHQIKTTLGLDLQLIESMPGLGYRINLHPALISIKEFTTLQV